MRIESLSQVFKNHPELVEKLMERAQARDSRGVERGFHKRSSAERMIVDAALDEKAAILFEEYIRAIIEELKAGNAVWAKKKEFLKGFIMLADAYRGLEQAKLDIAKLVEFRELPIEEKAQKMGSHVRKIEEIFERYITSSMKKTIQEIRACSEREKAQKTREAWKK